MSRALARTCAVALVCTVGGLALPAAAVAAAATAPMSTQGSQTKIAIKGFTYTKPALKVKVGDTITWTNQDDAPHDVATTKAPVKIKSPIMNKGQSFRYTFKKAGVYKYICSIHPQMTARVNVTAPKRAAAAKPARGVLAHAAPKA